MRIGINGFGRIGKALLRALCAGSHPLEVVAINDLMAKEQLLHAFVHDTAYGRFAGEAAVTGSSLAIGRHRLQVFGEREPNRIAWSSANVELVVDCTGRHTDGAKAREHLTGGSVAKVIVSAPMQGDDVTIVCGVNEGDYDDGRHHVISNASCTTNALAAVVAPLQAAFGWQHGLMTTTHAYTSDQNLLDGPHKDLRRARAAAMNLVPTSSGAARALYRVLPALKGAFEGFAIRAPVASVSMVTLVAMLGRPVQAEEANACLTQAAAKGPLKGILGVSDAPLVSQDFRGDARSAIVDLPLTQSVGPLLQISAWYDNEWAYAHRLADLAARIARSRH